MRWRWVLVPVLMLGCVFPAYAGPAAAAASAKLDSHAIDNYVAEMMDQDNLPGVSVSIVKGDDSYARGYGFADRDAGQPVTPDTLFELGSNSKAYTAVGLLLLADQGKVDLDAPVTRYLAGIEWRFNQAQTEPLVKDFLYQTSGMGSNSVALINPSTHDKALQDTVRNLADQPLWNKPGEQFLYSTGNYDVLGAVIEQVSGQSFESFMQEQMLTPLGLKGTYAGTANLPAEVRMSKGYKLGWTGNRSYDAPIYRGNIPAGYIVSDSAEMTRWLKIQLGLQEGIPEPLRSAVEQAHLPDDRVAETLTEPYDTPFRYGGGWLVFGQGDRTTLSHGGNNPNFSSYIIVDPTNKTGIAVMGNRNTTCTFAIAQGLQALLKGEEPAVAPKDITSTSDLAAAVLFFLTLLLSLGTIYRIYKAEAARRRGRRSFAGKTPSVYLKTAVWIMFAGLMLAVAWYIPKLLFWGYPWSFIVVWAPFTVVPAMVSLSVTSVLFASLRVYTVLFPMTNKDRPARIAV